MNQFSITAKNQPTYTIVPDAFILEYMPKANGSYVKVYLYLCLALSKNRPLSISELAESCNETENDIKRALQYWEKEGLLSLEINQNRTLTGIDLLTPVKEPAEDFNSEPPESLDTEYTPYMDSSAETYSTYYTESNKEPELAAAKEIPTPPKKEYSIVQIKEREKDTSFSQLVYMIETYFGRPFTQTDYHSLLYILDDLEFSLELLEYLVEYSVSKNKNSMRYIEAVAIAWHKEGIKTIKAAKLQSSSYNELYTLVAKSLGLGRNITSVEAEFIDNWQNKLGFEAAMIKEACNRAILHSPTSGTVTYVNGILETWNKAKVHNLSELAKFDEEYKKTKALKQNKSNAGSTKKALNYSQRTYNPDSLENLFLEEVNRTSSQGRKES
ncbi:MAG: DnaD domain protein [Lachnospiraceae bacterium]|nr:DnaD domain protein [Lachnospiraceae bacterium]